MYVLTFGIRTWLNLYLDMFSVIYFDIENSGSFGFGFDFFIVLKILNHLYI